MGIASLVQQGLDTIAQQEQFQQSLAEKKRETDLEDSWRQRNFAQTLFQRESALSAESDDSIRSLMLTNAQLAQARKVASSPSASGADQANLASLQAQADFFQTRRDKALAERDTIRAMLPPIVASMKLPPQFGGPGAGDHARAQVQPAQPQNMGGSAENSLTTGSATMAPEAPPAGASATSPVPQPPTTPQGLAPAAAPSAQATAAASAVAPAAAPSAGLRQGEDPAWAKWMQENQPSLRQGSYQGMEGNSLVYGEPSDAQAAAQTLKDNGITGLGVTTTAAREVNALKNAEPALPKIAATAAKHGINLIAHADAKQGVVFGSPQTVFDQKGIPVGTQLGSASFAGKGPGDVGPVLSALSGAAKDNPAVATAANDQLVGPIMAHVEDLKQSGQVIQSADSGRLVENPFVLVNGKPSNVHVFTVGLNQLSDAIGENSALPRVSVPSPVEATRLFLASGMNVTSNPKAVNQLVGYLRAGVGQDGRLSKEVSATVANDFTRGAIPLNAQAGELLLSNGLKNPVLAVLQPADAARVMARIKVLVGAQ